jgi:IclR family acetate operon transcriptional repressor
MGGFLLGAAGMFAVTYSTQAILPQLGRAFHVRPAEAGLTVSVVVLALACGAWLWGPLSDRYGRKRSMVLASSLLVAPTIGAALAPSFALLLAFRALQGLCMPGLLTAGVPYITEVFAPRIGGRAMGNYVTALIAGGLIGRVGVALLAAGLGCRWGIGLLAVLPLAAALVMRRSLIDLPLAPADGSRWHGVRRQLRNRRLLQTTAAGSAFFFTFVGTFSYVVFRLERPPFSFGPAAGSAVFGLWLLGIFGPALGTLADQSAGADSRSPSPMILWAPLRSRSRHGCPHSSWASLSSRSPTGPASPPRRSGSRRRATSTAAPRARSTTASTTSPAPSGATSLGSRGSDSTGKASWRPAGWHSAGGDGPSRWARNGRSLMVDLAAFSATRSPDGNHARTGQPAFRLVGAVQRAFSVLDALAEADTELGTNEIARRTGINTSSVSRLLATLVAGGLVEHVQDSGRYRLGLRLLQLGTAVLARLDLRQIARPHLQALVESTGETATLSAPGEHDAVTVDFVQSPSSVQGVARPAARASRTRPPPARCRSPSATARAAAGAAQGVHGAHDHATRCPQRRAEIVRERGYA